MKMATVFDASQSFCGYQLETACHTSPRSYKYCKKVLGLESY